MDYKTAGVDLSSLRKAKNDIKSLIKESFKGIYGEGHFASGSFIGNELILASVDGVGTKVEIAREMEIYNTIGEDLVNHLVNDMMSTGAEPFLFVDYIAFSHINPSHIVDIVKGMVKACKENNLLLVAGETAQMPDIYHENKFDLAGTIIGRIEKNSFITGKYIRPSHIIYALPSSGPHTNGYSLIRKVIKEKDLNLNEKVFGNKSLGELLLAVHKSYRKDIIASKKYLSGIAHITGGGLKENIERILPPHVNARINKQLIRTLPVFKYIMEKGDIKEEEMFKVFNMGIGMVFIAPRKYDLPFEDGYIIGEIEKGEGKVILS